MPRPRKNNSERDISPWAKKIRDLRLDNDLTQQAVADYLNVSQRVYADYELGT
jgi:transcriptional regulator with XRE-family HTH domain